MKEELISFDTAVLAKEKGFKWGTLQGWELKGIRTNKKLCTIGNYYLKGHNKREISIDQIRNNNVKNSVSRPTQSLLQKWLREEHNIHINILYPTDENDYINTPMFKIQILEKIPQSLFKRYKTGSDFYTYEEALEKGLQEALKLIK